MVKNRSERRITLPAVIRAASPNRPPGTAPSKHLEELGQTAMLMRNYGYGFRPPTEKTRSLVSKTSAPVSHNTSSRAPAEADAGSLTNWPSSKMGAKPNLLKHLEGHIREQLTVIHHSQGQDRESITTMRGNMVNYCLSVFKVHFRTYREVFEVLHDTVEGMTQLFNIHKKQKERLDEHIEKIEAKHREEIQSHVDNEEMLRKDIEELHEAQGKFAILEEDRKVLRVLCEDLTQQVAKLKKAMEEQTEQMRHISELHVKHSISEGKLRDKIATGENHIKDLEARVATLSQDRQDLLMKLELEQVAKHKVEKQRNESDVKLAEAEAKIKELSDDVAALHFDKKRMIQLYGGSGAPPVVRTIGVHHARTDRESAQRERESLTPRPDWPNIAVELPPDAATSAEKVSCLEHEVLKARDLIKDGQKKLQASQESLSVLEELHRAFDSSMLFDDVPQPHKKKSAVSDKLFVSCGNDSDVPVFLRAPSEATIYLRQMSLQTLLAHIFDVFRFVTRNYLKITPSEFSTEYEEMVAAMGANPKRSFADAFQQWLHSQPTLIRTSSGLAAPETPDTTQTAELRASQYNVDVAYTMVYLSQHTYSANIFCRLFIHQLAGEVPLTTFAFLQAHLREIRQLFERADSLATDMIAPSVAMNLMRKHFPFYSEYEIRVLAEALMQVADQQRAAQRSPTSRSVSMSTSPPKRHDKGSDDVSKSTASQNTSIPMEYSMLAHRESPFAHCIAFFFVSSLFYNMGRFTEAIQNLTPSEEGITFTQTFQALHQTDVQSKPESIRRYIASCIGVPPNSVAAKTKVDVSLMVRRIREVYLRRATPMNMGIFKLDQVPVPMIVQLQLKAWQLDKSLLDVAGTTPRPSLTRSSQPNIDISAAIAAHPPNPLHGRPQKPVRPEKGVKKRKA